MEAGCTYDDEIKLGCTNISGNFEQNVLHLYYSLQSPFDGTLYCRAENPNFDISYEHEIMILLSGQGDFGDPEFINVFECTCEGDLCNSACKQTTAICNSASKQTIAAVFTWAFVVFASVIL